MDSSTLGLRQRNSKVRRRNYKLDHSRLTLIKSHRSDASQIEALLQEIQMSSNGRTKQGRAQDEKTARSIRSPGKGAEGCEQRSSVPSSVWNSRDRLSQRSFVENRHRSDAAELQSRLIARVRRAAARQASGPVPASIMIKSIGPASCRSRSVRTSGEASVASRAKTRRHRECRSGEPETRKVMR